jgi:hypothetical protein
MPVHPEIMDRAASQTTDKPAFLPSIGLLLKSMTSSAQLIARQPVSRTGSGFFVMVMADFLSHLAAPLQGN